MPSVGKINPALMIRFTVYCVVLAKCSRFNCLGLEGRDIAMFTKSVFLSTLAFKNNCPFASS